jgi:hypothetical protein
MKIYFSSSLTAKKLYQQNFEKIYDAIKDAGHTHTSDFIIKADMEEYRRRQSGEDFAKYYKDIITQMKKADICIFEVSRHSLGVGYCVNLALQMGKPVVLLYLKGFNPIFFKGIKSDKLLLYEYDPSEIAEVLGDALNLVRDLTDIRFTFFINPKINQFLDWVAKNKKAPRAVYLRNLLTSAMKREGFK